MRAAITAQCFGTLSLELFTFGIILLYLMALNFSSAMVLFCLSVPNFIALFRVIPAWLADRYGKKRIGNIGHGLVATGYTLITVAGLLDGRWQAGFVYLGIVLFAFGDAFFSSSWYILLNDIVPESIRGRFLGKLRFTWQTTTLIFIALCTWALKSDASIWKYQIILGLVTLAALTRIYFYNQIPETPSEPAGQQSLWTALRAVLSPIHYRSFCAYVFMLSLMTMSVPAFFGLVEKDVLGLGDSVVAMLGVMIMAGALIGYIVGGKWVDAYGTKSVFIVCHFAYALILILFVVRGLAGSWLLPYLSGVHFFFGFINACSSIAIATSILELLPIKNRSISASFSNSMIRFGGATAGIASAWLMQAKALSPSWQMGKLTLSQYDTLLLMSAFAVVLLVVILGLVPSVWRKAEWIPGSS